MRKKTSDSSGLPGTSAWAVGMLFQGFECTFGLVEPEPGFPFVGIGAVAGQAFIGQNGPDVEVIADRFGNGFLLRRYGRP